MPDQNPEAPAATTTKPGTKPRARKAKKKPAARANAAKSDTKTSAQKKVGRFVVLFRHGLAENRALGKPDEDRSLTTAGHEKTKRAAKGIASIFPEADTLFSSPLLRAMQTALWLTKAYKDKLKIQTTDALVPAAGPAQLAELLAKQEGRNILMVGHEPNLTDSLAHLLGLGGSARADLKKAGCIGVRIDENGLGTLEWMLAPRMLRRLG